MSNISFKYVTVFQNVRALLFIETFRVPHPSVFSLKILDLFGKKVCQFKIW